MEPPNNLLHRFNDWVKSPFSSTKECISYPAEQRDQNNLSDKVKRDNSSVTITRIKSVQPTSFTPFYVAHYLAKHKSEALITAAYRLIIGHSQLTLNKSGMIEDAKTSCIHNMMALCLLFSGLEKSQLIFKRFLVAHSVDLGSNSTEFKWKFRVSNLFTGQLLTNLYKLFPQRNWVGTEPELLDICIPPLIDDFMKNTTPLITNCVSNSTQYGRTCAQRMQKNLKTALKKLQYDFNSPTINDLKHTIERNLDRVDASTSVMYYISIRKPVQYEGQDAENLEIYHAFVIEQFLNLTQNKPQFRLYQAWRGSMSLLEYFKQCKYDKEGRGCLDIEHMMEFIDDLKLMFCAPQEDAVLISLRRKWFHVRDSENPPVLYFDQKSHTLRGMCLHYQASIIHPQESLHNLNIIIQTAKLLRNFSS